MIAAPRLPAIERPAPDIIVELRDVTVDFSLGGGAFGGKRRKIRAVDHVTLAVERGRTLGLVGNTGSGKSTVGHVVMGMVRPTSGSVIVDGSEVAALGGSALRAQRRRIQVVLQDPYSSLDPRMRVRDIIAEPITLGRPAGRGAGRVRARVNELLGLVGLNTTRAELYPHQFSGGQRQRIAIARALASEPTMIVLDEPTSALDVSVRAQIINLLQSLQERLGVSYLMISHDLVSVAYLSSTVAVMFEGRIVEIGPTNSLYEAPKHPYTLLLIRSAPSPEGAFMRPLPTLAPTAADASAGCRYYARCPLRAKLGDPEVCRSEDPALRPVSHAHFSACHFSERMDAFAGGS